MEKNRSLTSARKAKNDEFYTQLSDIENELRHYKAHFRGKTVFCNCDDPEASNFWKYFSLNFEHLGLKRLITTHYVRGGQSYALEFTPGDKPDLFPADRFKKTMLTGDGDFRSEECIGLLKQADIVVTNPPFSLFREYLRQLVDHDKKFLIIGSKNAITYKEVFKLIAEGRLWLGVGFNNGNAFFKTPDPSGFQDGVYDPKTGLVKFRNVGWFTNLDHAKRHEEMILYRSFWDDPSFFPKYDNYDAIEVSRIKDIPLDYNKEMGVPITFLDRFDPDQFEIIWTTDRGGDGYLEHLKLRHTRFDAPLLNGEAKYKRIIIRKRK